MKWIIILVTAFLLFGLVKVDGQEVGGQKVYGPPGVSECRVYMPEVYK